MPASGRTRPRWLLAIGLFFAAPFVAEFLLGNTPITAGPWGLLLAPMYGGGAVLIREIGRRTGGWPTMLLLAAAYGLLEEGPIDQMLFNPGYLGLDSFAWFAPIPGLEISAGLTASSLVMHTVWSICVPIAVLEAFDRHPADGDPPRPWLGRIGMTVSAAVFVVGSAGLALMQYDEHQFIGTPLQFAVTGAVIVGLIVAAFVVGRRPQREGHDTPRLHRGPTPRPLWAGLTAYAVTTGYWLIDMVGLWFVGPWTLIGIKAAMAAGCAVRLTSWSRRPGWGRRHRFAVAAGALLTYTWVGFPHAMAMGYGVTIALLGGTVCGTAALLVLLFAARSERRAAPDSGRAVLGQSASGRPVLPGSV
jgi:hypothetical protein